MLSSCNVSCSRRRELELTCAKAPLAIPPQGFFALAKFSKVTLAPASSPNSLLRIQQMIFRFLEDIVSLSQSLLAHPTAFGGFYEEEECCHLAAVIAPSLVTSNLPSSLPPGRLSNLQRRDFHFSHHLTSPAARESKRRPVKGEMLVFGRSLQ